MRLVIPLHEVRDEDREQVGGKAFSLARLARMSLNVPDALCIPAEVYNHYVASTGLKERILLELNRKNFQEISHVPPRTGQGVSQAVMRFKGCSWRWPNIPLQKRD